MNKILLVGRPNVGKSYLFNELTGDEQKIANFSGVTVKVKSKKLLDLKNEGLDLSILDLPGLYSLKPKSEDEVLALNTLEAADSQDLVCVVIEALKIKSQSRLLLEIYNLCSTKKIPMVLAINMKDEADLYSFQIDILNLKKDLNLDLFYLSAKTKENLNLFKDFIKSKKWNTPKTEISNLNFISSIDKNIKYPQKNFVLAQNYIDKFLLSSWIGPFSFLILTFVLFQSIFSWSEPFMNLIESSITLTSDLVTPYFTGHLKSFISSAIFSGFGAFLVFTPQIFILTFIITFLEKSGYMARAVTLCHQPLSWFGLHGKSFIPLITGHACAVPAIYSARTLENPIIRKLTIFVIPLTACSARLPVYGLLIQALIPKKFYFFNLLGLQGIAFFMLYFFGIFMALLVSALVTKFSKFPSVNDNFILELPRYRLPEAYDLFKKSFQNVYDFIVNAGPTIFVLNAALWFLSYFPNGAGEIKTSYLGQLGQWMEPVFLPMGLDWIFGVAILSSFVAREVFVSTLALLYGLSEGATIEIVNSNQMQNLSLASGISLLVFFAIALQCMSTVAVLRQEIGAKLAYVALFGYLILAYTLSVITYYILSL